MILTPQKQIWKDREKVAWARKCNDYYSGFVNLLLAPTQALYISCTCRKNYFYISKNRRLEVSCRTYK